MATFSKAYNQLVPDRQDVARANVRALADRKGMSLKTVAARSGVAESTLYNWLAGTYDAGELVLSRLATFFGTPVEHLFYNSPSEQPADEATPPDEAGKARAIREIQQLIDSVDDPAERLRIINIVRATLRAAVDEYARDAGAGGDAPRAARRAAGRGRKGAEGGPVG